ncbi:unnamed protein product [Ascophyllum nodosum]
MSFNRYRRELYDRPKTSLLSLKPGAGRETTVPSRTTTFSNGPDSRTYEAIVRTRRLLRAGVLARMSDRRFPSGSCLESWRTPGSVRGGARELIDCAADGIRMFEIRCGWRTAASEPRRWYGTVREGRGNQVVDRSDDRRHGARKRERAAKNRHRKTEADRVVLASGVIAGEQIRLRAAPVGLLLGSPKRRRLCR